MKITIMKQTASFLMVSILLLSCSERKVTRADIRPNIIFILTDDQRWDALGAMGNTILKTPNLDTISKKGILFQNAYVTTSICCTSRASILTGQYATRHHINDFSTGFTGDALSETYPMLLQKEGYKIGFIGKYGVGDATTHPKEQFDFWACTDQLQPDYEHVDEQGNYIHYTDVIANDIAAFLEETDERPFNLSVSFKAPHVQDGDPRQFIPNPRYNMLYEDVAIPLPKTADPKYWKVFPDFFRTDENIARERWKLRFNTPEKYQQSVKNYYRLITGVDEVVGKLMQQLKKEGLDKNTVILFMGDNGMFLGEHGLAGKWYAYEESVRVPLIIYDPREGALSGKIVDDIALNIDIAPTVLGFAGIDIPRSMQGMDLVERLDNGDTTRTSFFYEHSFMGSPGIPKVEALISRTIKYTRYTEHDYEELYDLIKDPQEEYNAADDPAYEAILKQQKIQFDSLRQLAR